MCDPSRRSFVIAGITALTLGCLNTDETEERSAVSVTNDSSERQTVHLMTWGGPEERSDSLGLEPGETEDHAMHVYQDGGCLRVILADEVDRAVRCSPPPGGYHVFVDDETSLTIEERE